MQTSGISRGPPHKILDDCNIIKDTGRATNANLEQGSILTYQTLKSINGYIKYIESQTK
jgi:hypothetical protein